MTRRSALGRHSLRIHREFVPSRCQLRALALAFEQALPIIRRPLTTPARPQMFVDSDLNSFTQPGRSGALR